jgi:hypothetical protein
MYLANKQISLTEAADAYEGIEMVKITFDDATTEVMPKKLYEASVTEQPSDLTAMRQARIQVVTKEVLSLLLMWGIRVDEVQYLTSLLVGSINQSIQAAESKLWGKNSLDLNLIDVDKVVREKVTLKDIMPPSTPGQPEGTGQPPATQ